MKIEGKRDEKRENRVFRVKIEMLGSSMGLKLPGIDVYRLGSGFEVILRVRASKRGRTRPKNAKKRSKLRFWEVLPH